MELNINAGYISPNGDHDNNSTKGDHDNNSTNGDHDNNSTNGDHDNNSTKGDHDNNSTKGDHDNNSTNADHDSISGNADHANNNTHIFRGQDCVNIQTCWKSRWFIVLIAAGIGAGIGAVIGAGIGAGVTHTICNNDYSEFSKQSGLPWGNIPNGIKPQMFLRIYLNGSSCEYPTCLNYTQEILRSNASIREPQVCDSISEVKNSSCYMCNNRCVSFDEIKPHIGTTLDYTGCRITVTCCLVATMGNLGGHCGDNGTYKCIKEEMHDSDYELICDCDDGFMGDKCNKTNTHTVPCTCFKTTYKFIKEEDIVECSDIIQPGVTVCHTRFHKETDEYNCLCDTNVTDASS